MRSQLFEVENVVELPDLLLELEELLIKATLLFPASARSLGAVHTSHLSC